MRVLVVTDAWRPQVNGVVRTIEQLVTHAPTYGAEIVLLTPQAFRTAPLPTYPEIRLALARAAVVGGMIDAAKVDHIHISTEGPLGLAARRACLRRGLAFTTSYHTRFPEYVRRRMPIPERWTYAWLRRFHNAGDGMMVATDSLARDLAGRGFERLMRCTRGVDADRFRPRPGVDVFGLPRPVFLYVGRIATEKNIEGFLSLDLPGSKVVVGDGPSRAALAAAFPAARFTGSLDGEALAEAYSSAEVFVFPSRTDTFGIVILEALASGLPVAAFPVTGPIDVLSGSGAGAGALNEDLRAAALAALEIPKEKARAVALQHGWSEAARMFVENVRTVMARRAKRLTA
ncbi:glycosyltransferase family 4 protein [Hansschlegelia zhihuaiae]|uniref:Glycosyltransferase family 1 protein n=1 Tax=Hansschlegelia zhihuaiae TaxID=405005 RepID=A0A4Q0MMK6_9HYPH|nr:glycosyltransferase family 1 protein [Hansschlegelia zhihuaiae]RXF74990.1 glycosyltransferase family 1 protein [Hansschlegelia zhihuaiae]